MPAKDRRHYQGDYLRRARSLREWAADNPHVARCARCGAGPRPDDPWDAGHVRDGDPGSPLQLEHASCNRRAGQALSMQRRKVDADRPKTSRRWR